MSTDFKAAAERKTEEIIAICGAYVPGGWAHPGEECAEKIAEVIMGAPAQQGVTISTEELLRSLVRAAVEIAFARHDLKSDEAKTFAEDDDIQGIGQDVEHACFGESGCSEEPLPQIVEIMRRAAPAPPVSEGLKANEHCGLCFGTGRSAKGGTGETEICGCVKEADSAEIVSHGVTFLNPPLSEEEAKELKASEPAPSEGLEDRLRVARQAGLAKLKGACAYAAGFPITAEHGYSDGHAEAWKRGWEYARDFLTAPDVRALSPRNTQAGPRCPKCGSKMAGWFTRTSVNKTSAVKLHCLGAGADDLSFHEFVLTKTDDLAQFFPLPSPEPHTKSGHILEDIDDAIQGLRSGWPYPDVIAILEKCIKPLPSPEQGWVKVEDRLPEVGETVIGLVCGEYPCLIEMEYPVSVPWLIEPIKHGHKITHWQPFPAPPRPSTEEGK